MHKNAVNKKNSLKSICYTRRIMFTSVDSKIMLTPKKIVHFTSKSEPYSYTV